MNENVNNKNIIHYTFYSKSSIINNTYYLGESTIYDFLKDHSKIAKQCDIYSYKYDDLPSEEEMIRNLVKIKSYIN